MPAPSTWRGPLPARRPRRWLLLLRQAAWVLLPALLLWAVLSLMDMAEGDLRQVRAPLPGATVC
jgi:hypothetical protein